MLCIPASCCSVALGRTVHDYSTLSVHIIQGFANAHDPYVQGPLPATPPGKAMPEQPPQFVAGSPAAMQLWARWFRDLGALCLLLLSLWLLRRAVRDAAAGTAVGAAGSMGGPGFWQDRRILLQPGSPGPLLEALPAVISQ